MKGTSPHHSSKRGSIRLGRLPRSFYLRPTVAVAKDLLGKFLVSKIGRKRLIGRIVEVEAYCEGDPASHSYRGMTKRNEVMFWEGGHLYVYFTYGMHYCANVVTRREGIGEAVLIRAVESVEGIEVMMKNRAKREVISPKSAFRIPQLTNGPAKVCQAFGITRTHNGIDLCDDEIFIAASSSPQSLPASQNSLRQAAAFRIRNSARIGIRSGRDKMWRFYVEGNRFVSRIKPSR